MNEEALLNLVNKLPHEEKASLLALLDELSDRKRASAMQNDFLRFIAAMEPTYKFGTHLKRLGNLLMDVEEGIKDRIAVSMAPRFGKSQMISIFYPAWYLGKHPDHKVIVASHTVDLAVDMARKVRNLMQSPEYQAIFPGVKIASDAKAAGKWNTNKGGEYFACLRLDAKVTTPYGVKNAGDVIAGDKLQNASGYVTVQQVYPSTHEATYTIAGLRCSAKHPIWTMNRGWVYAAEVTSSDILCVESISDRLEALVLGAFSGNLEHTHVPSMVRNETTLRAPIKRQVAVLRRARDNSVRALADFCKLLCGYGGPTYASVYDRSIGCKRAIQPGELPVGDAKRASKQPPYECAYRWTDASGACTPIGDNTRGYSTSDAQGCRPTSQRKEADEELRAYGNPENLGWLRRAAARLFTEGITGDTPRKQQCSAESYMARATRASQKLLGFLLGVRRVGVIEVETHTAQPFINFLTDGDHTFYADGVLTHNCGTGGALAGRGAHLIVADDVLSEQDIKAGNTNSLDTTYEWYRSGLRTRLMPGGKICVLHTRWHQRDVIGRLIKDAAMNPEADQYEIFEFPAILNENTPEAKSLWPEQWSLESLLRTKASMPAWQWNAQYQQNPTAQESAIIKREHIRWWAKERPPQVEYIIQSYDTALTTKERSDYSVCQTWGVFKDPNADDPEQTNMILLNCVKGKWEFPELKRMAMDQYADWEPDSVIVEAKASGQPLIDEMRRSGIFVQDFSPGKGQDKLARLNSVSDMFFNGQVWFPETKWAEEVVDELCSFPAAEHDDLVDACTLGLIRARKGGLLRLANDREDNTYIPVQRRGSYY